MMVYGYRDMVIAGTVCEHVAGYDNCTAAAGEFEMLIARASGVLAIFQITGILDKA